MYKSVRGVGVVALVLGLFGCSAIPDQATMTGVDIVDIIQNVRCEFKDAVMQYPENDPLNDLIIAYNFEFTSMEENVVAGGATLSIPLNPGTFKIGFDAAERGHREDTRTVLISETIGNVRKLNCQGRAPGDSLHYPITGKIGIKGVVDRYATLQHQQGLKIGTFTDQLHFWLQLEGTMKPSVALVPVAKNTLDASATIGGSRKDTHKMLLTISKKKFDAPLRVEITNLPGGVTQLRSGNKSNDDVTGRPRGTAQGVDPRDRAMRDLQNERSLRIHEEILDRLR